MDKIKNLSIRKTIILYMAIAIVGSFLLGAWAMFAAEREQQKIWWKYADKTIYTELQENLQMTGYMIDVPRPDAYEMNEWDSHLSEICDFVQTYSILCFSVIGMIMAVFLFYKNKISTPLMELTYGSDMIAANELDFQVGYDNKDELGTLCRQFETMRQALYENNQHMWKMIEEQKMLRAAIAHDIRSPLSVLRGYQEMMLEFLPEERFDKAALMEMLQDGMSQIDVLNRFIESMGRLSSLEQREPNLQQTSMDLLKNRIQQSIYSLEKETHKTAEIQFYFHREEAAMDLDMIMEASENLFGNAFSYAKNIIKVDVVAKEQRLEITILDDGCGFSEEAEIITKAYYHSNNQDDLEHFGLGMYISRLYCEKHGGKLLTGNSEAGGAMVKAIFSL